MTFHIISPTLGQILSDDSWLSLLPALKVIAGLFFFVLSVALTIGAILLIHFFLSLPMRRAERVRLFLDLVEDGLNRGQSIEAMMLSVAQSRDPSPGVRFYLVAAHIENGLSFDESVRKVSGFLPGAIIEILHTGRNLGDIRQILPACREILRERPPGVRSAVHYMFLLILFFSPAAIFTVLGLEIWILPRFKDVFAGMGMHVPPVTAIVFSAGHIIAIVQLIMLVLLLLAAILYVGGPRLTGWFQIGGIRMADRMAWQVPWKRKRLKRTFSAMLAVLLDSNVPEYEAINLAGTCTANEICKRRAHNASSALAGGVSLKDAVRRLDDNGEFRWRLSNAAQMRGGFLKALHGWHETLDARAFQQEEAAAHVITTGMVILNGLIVTLLATAIFAVFASLLNNLTAQ